MGGAISNGAPWNKGGKSDAPCSVDPACIGAPFHGPLMLMSVLRRPTPYADSRNRNRRDLGRYHVGIEFLAHRRNFFSGVMEIEHASDPPATPWPIASFFPPYTQGPLTSVTFVPADGLAVGKSGRASAPLPFLQSHHQHCPMAEHPLCFPIVLRMITRLSKQFQLSIIARRHYIRALRMVQIVVASYP